MPTCADNIRMAPVRSGASPAEGRRRDTVALGQGFPIAGLRPKFQSLDNSDGRELPKLSCEHDGLHVMISRCC